MLTPLAQRVVDAYGGEERWRTAAAVECRVSAHGWAFRMKLRRAMRRVSIRAEIAIPRLQMIEWPSAAKRVVIE
ncbi:MAG TPA: hypothetical protein VMR52_04775 [Dehalococcoidia bacterium]|nr:hypothetical protein [Dehalococcoidia bacterium]